MPKAKRIILLLDDDDDDALFFEYAIRQCGEACDVRVGKNGQAGIDYLLGYGEFADRAKHPLPALLVTDLKMPVMDGFDFLSWLQKNRQCTNTHVVVMSNSHLECDVDRCYDLGTNAYLHKPLQPSDLIELVRLMVAFWFRSLPRSLPSL